MSRTEFVDKYGSYVASVLVGALASALTALLGSIGGGGALAALLAAVAYWSERRAKQEHGDKE